MLRICSTTQTVVQVCDSLESATGVRFFSRSDCCFQKLAVWQLFREHVPQCTHNEPWLVWSYRMSLLMYRKTPWNNHASVITIILIYLRWQTEWFCSGSMDTHVDSSTKENVSKSSISKRHSCIEKPKTGNRYAPIWDLTQKVPCRIGTLIVYPDTSNSTVQLSS